MGGRSWDSTDWTRYSSTSATAAAAPTAHSYFKARSIDNYLDPSKFQMRESRNSAANPESTPIILGLDVTGSMGMIAKEIASKGLGTLIKEIFDRKPVSDPHIMFMGIGDANYDQAPLQASQFEADFTMVEQLEKLYVESGGGGNSWESYNLPWHFAQYHTSCDAFEKDDRMGYIFTFGDEPAPPDLTQTQLNKVYSPRQEQVATNRQLLELLSDKYHVFHLMIEQGSHMSYARQNVIDSWLPLLGQNAIPVSDYTKLGEIIVSTMQITSGVDKDTVAKSWSGDTSLVVANATRNLSAKSASTGIVRF